MLKKFWKNIGNYIPAPLKEIFAGPADHESFLKRMDQLSQSVQISTDVLKQYMEKVENDMEEGIVPTAYGMHHDLLSSSPSEEVQQPGTLLFLINPLADLRSQSHNLPERILPILESLDDLSAEELEKLSSYEDGVAVIYTQDSETFLKLDDAEINNLSWFLDLWQKRQDGETLDEGLQEFVRVFRDTLGLRFSEDDDSVLAVYKKFLHWHEHTRPKLLENNSWGTFIPGKLN